jgi:hypothetical protein
MPTLTANLFLQQDCQTADEMIDHWNDAVGFDAFVTATVAGVVAVCVCIAIRARGGMVGGAIATLPYVVVFTAARFSMQHDERHDLVSVMYETPFGTFINVCALKVWLWTSRGSAEARNDYARLMFASVTTIVFWFVASAGFVHLIVWLRDTVHISFVITGLAALGASAFVSISLVATHPRPAPNGVDKAVALKTHVFRFAFAFALMFLAVVGGTAAPRIGGLAMLFPASTMTALVATTLTHGFVVMDGAVGPMMLGELASPAFAIAYAFVFPRVVPVDGGGDSDATINLKTVGLCAACWLFAALVVALPLHKLIVRLYSRTSMQMYGQVAVDDDTGSGLGVASPADYDDDDGDGVVEMSGLGGGGSLYADDDELTPGSLMRGGDDGDNGLYEDGAAAGAAAGVGILSQMSDFKNATAAAAAGRRLAVDDDIDGRFTIAIDDDGF